MVSTRAQRQRHDAAASSSSAPPAATPTSHCWSALSYELHKEICSFLGVSDCRAVWRTTSSSPPSVSAYQERDEWLKINICPPARRLKEEALATLIRRYKYAPNLTVHVQDIRGLTALIHAISVGAACNVPRLYITTIMASHCIFRKSLMVALANALHQEGGGLPMARAIHITYVHKLELGAKEIFIRALGNAAPNLSP
jgi:hypothetical protein